MNTATETIPIMLDVAGVICITGTRVTLDTVVGAFQDGATAEEIVDRYPSLDLADVYSVVAYYLRHTPDVEAYLQQRRTQANAVRVENEKRFDPRGIRDRLMARRASTGA